MQGAWDGGQAGEGGSCWSDQRWSQGWTEAAGEEGKRLQGWQAQLHVEGSTCAMGHRGVTSVLPVKWDSLVRGAPAHLGPAGSSPGNFLQLCKPNFLGSAP